MCEEIETIYTLAQTRTRANIYIYIYLRPKVYIVLSIYIYTVVQTISCKTTTKCIIIYRQKRLLQTDFRGA